GTDSNGKDRRPIVPSYEVSGTVERVGAGVTDMKRGAPVYGLLNFWRDGAAAELVAARAADLAPKPRSLDQVHAAAVPLSGLTAWQALFDHGGVLRPGGVLVTIAGDAPETIAAKYGVRGVSMLVQPNKAELVEIAGLIDAGRVRPVVDAVFPLPQAREAFERGLLGHTRGKLVLQVVPPSDAGGRSS